MLPPPPQKIAHIRYLVLIRERTCTPYTTALYYESSYAYRTQYKPNLSTMLIRTYEYQARPIIHLVYTWYNGQADSHTLRLFACVLSAHQSIDPQHIQLVPRNIKKAHLPVRSFCLACIDTPHIQLVPGTGKIVQHTCRDDLAQQDKTLYGETVHGGNRNQGRERSGNRGRARDVIAHGFPFPFPPVPCSPRPYFPVPIFTARAPESLQQSSTYAGAQFKDSSCWGRTERILSRTCTGRTAGSSRGQQNTAAGGGEGGGRSDPHSRTRPTEQIPINGICLPGQDRSPGQHDLHDLQVMFPGGGRVISMMYLVIAHASWVVPINTQILHHIHTDRCRIYMI